MRVYGFDIGPYINRNATLNPRDEGSAREMSWLTEISDAVFGEIAVFERFCVGSQDSQVLHVPPG